jgi:CelD/BcsL family acetyltransferase involved in cellulose biosynthesis
MRIRVVQTTTEMALLAPDWNRLARGVPFRSFEWLDCWWRHYGQCDDESLRPDAALLALVASDEQDAVVGIAPWYCERSLTGGQVIRFLGSGEIYSDYLSVLSAPGREAEVAGAVADWLSQSCCRDWDALELTGVDAEDITTRQLVSGLQHRGLALHVRPDLCCWRIDLPATWEAYLDTLSKSHRKQMRRAERRLDDDRLACHTARSVDDAAQALEILIELHQRRQRSLGRPGCFDSEQFVAFHRDAVRRLAAAGQARIDWIERDGQPIAAEYQLLGSDVVYAYQSGIAPEWLSLEPGRMVMVAAIRAAIAGRYRVYDFLRGDEPYKAHWRAVPRRTLRARVVAPHRGARMRNSLWLARDAARLWLKQSLVAPPVR